MPNPPPSFASDAERRDWVLQRWREFESMGPLGIRPSQTSHAVGNWEGQEFDFYAGLYPLEPFSNLADFELFGCYSSSIQQDLIRDGEVDMEYFFAQTATEVAEAELVRWQDRDVETNDAMVKSLLRQWSLPDALDWVFRLTFQKVVHTADEESLELSAQCTEGYLSLFALDG